MTPDVRRKALLAASSVVLALGSGCDLTVLDPPTQVVTQPPTLDTGETGDTGQLVDLDEPDCTQTADMGACCSERSTWCEDQGFVDLAHSECVFGPGFDGSTGCIPWGPPVPPAFTGRALT